MGQFRIKYGSAWGPQNNFYARETAGLFVSGDTTPDVTDGTLFYTNNTSNTTITYFDVSAPGNPAGNNAGLFEGKYITVVFLDDSTGLAASSRMILSSSDSLAGAGNVIQLLYNTSNWREISRSYNNSQFLNISSMNMGGIVGASTTGVINVAGNVKTVLILSGASSASTLRRAVNGQQGQILTLAAFGSNALIIVNSAANDTFISTSSVGATQFRLQPGAAVSFVKIGTAWQEIVPISPNSAGYVN